jgi:battenin
VTYTYLLPSWGTFQRTAAYQALATEEPEGDGEGDVARVRIASESDTFAGAKVSGMYLSPRDKIELLRPLVLRYMLPLCLVYIEEYVINSVG